MTKLHFLTSLKRRVKLLLFATLFLNLPFAGILAQEMEVFGYYEPQFTTFRINDTNAQFQSNKLRLDFSHSYSDRFRVQANLNLYTYHGKTSFDFLDYLPLEFSSNMTEETRAFYSFEFSDRNELDNAFISMGFGKFDLAIGKQQLSFGSGYAWNPADVFNTKDAFDPTYEQPGVNAVRLDGQLSDRQTLTVIYLPEETFSQSTKFIRYGSRLQRFDYALSFASFDDFHTDYYSFLISKLARRMFALDVSGEIFTLGVHLEAAHNAMDGSSGYREILAGIDYTFESGLLFMNEYYYNGLGKDGNYDLNDWMRSFRFESRTISRQNLFTFISYPLQDLLTGGCTLITSLSDNSYVLIPNLDYNFEENLDISLYMNLMIGQGGDAFSSLLGNGGFVRARYYF